jgi:hypothetical protein
MLPRKIKHSTSTFTEYIALLPAWGRQLLRYITLTRKVLKLYTAIALDKIV